MDWIASIIVGVLAMVGTIVSSTLAANKTQTLLGYRIDQLEKKVEKHNTVVERTYKIEQDLATAFVRIDDLRNDITEIKGEINK